DLWSTHRVLDTQGIYRCEMLVGEIASSWTVGGSEPSAGPGEEGPTVESVTGIDGHKRLSGVSRFVRPARRPGRAEYVMGPGPVVECVCCQVRHGGEGTRREHQRGQRRAHAVNRLRPFLSHCAVFCGRPVPRLPAFPAPDFDGKEAAPGSSPGEGSKTPAK